MDRTKSKSPNPISTTIISVALVALLFAGFILAYFPVWKSLILAWSGSEDYSHGFFIIPICLYVLWRKKDVLANLPARPSRWGLVVLICSLLLYLFSRFAEIVTIASLSMVPLLAGAIIYLYGFQFLKETAFPLFLLLFMIPIPSQIYSSLTIPLQLLVTKASVWLASIFGVSVLREGNVIHLPERTLQVVQACSGMRSMISLLTLSAVFGYFTLKSSLMRTSLFLSGIPVAIAVNIVRVLLILLAFQYFDYDLTTGATHTALGILVFLLALIALFLIKGALTPWDRSLAQS